MNENQNSTLVSDLKFYLEGRATLMRKIHVNPSWKYSGFEELVMDCGVMVTTTKPLPANIEPGLPQYCFFCCQELAFANQNLIYTEGYAVSSTMPLAVEHAWLMTSEADVIEPTWTTPGLVYWGVPLSTQWLKSFLATREKISKVEDVSVFQGNHIEKLSLLKEGFPPEAFALK